MSYNPTPRQHLNAVSTSIMGIVSTLSDAGQTEQPIAGAIPCHSICCLMMSMRDAENESFVANVNN